MQLKWASSLIKASWVRVVWFILSSDTIFDFDWLIMCTQGEEKVMVPSYKILSPWTNRETKGGFTASYFIYGT